MCQLPPAFVMTPVLCAYSLTPLLRVVQQDPTSSNATADGDDVGAEMNQPSL